MLLLSRQVDQKVVIRVPRRKRPIVIMVTAIEREYRTILGFDADDDIEILRDELVKKE